MSKNEWHGSPTGGWEHRECRKTKKRSYLYEDEGSKFSSKKQAYGKNYTMRIDGQQNGNGERGGGQFGYGREKLVSYDDGNELYGNSRHFSERRYNYMNQSSNFDLNQNLHFESMEKSYNSMGDGKFEIVGDDSRSEEESSDSGTWSHQGNADQTHTFDRGWNRYRGQRRPWNPGGRGFRSTKRWRNGHSTGHREKSILQMSSKEKIHKLCIFLRNDIQKVNAIQTIENGLASSRLGLKSEYHVQECKTVGGKPHFTGVLKLSGVFMGRSFGTNKKETKHGAYDTALDNLIHKSVDEIFQLLDPGIEAIRDEEDVSAELETNHKAQKKCHVHISDADSVQTGNNNTQMINIAPGQEKQQVNVYQSGYGGSQQVTVNINLKEERRSSDSERGTKEEFCLRIQASRQDGKRLRSAVDLEKIGLRALRTEEGLQLIIKPMERVLGAETVSITEGSIIIRLRPNNKDFISKLKASIKNEELHRILGRMIELEKVKSACAGCPVILDITACIPVEDFHGKNKSVMKQGSILIQFRQKSQDSNSRLKTSVETGDLQRIFTRFAELKQVRSALRGSDLVLNVTATLPKSKKQTPVSQIRSCKDQNLGELPENDSSNISSNPLSERIIELSDTVYNNSLKSACQSLNLNRIETQPNTQLISTYKSSWMFHSTPFDDKDESGKTIHQMQPTEKDVRDIQLLLIKAYESVQIISINPVFDTSVYWKELEDFYTDIVIDEEREESAERRKDEQQVNKMKVTSFRQVFEKDTKKVTRIILKAPAGLGKSTFCRKLVHTWCSFQKKKLNPLIDARISDKSETYGLKDEDEMLRFDVLLYICLGDISDEKTLIDVVYTQFPLDVSKSLSHKSHIEALIGQAEENSVLLVMDGLDEMENCSSFIEKIMQRSLYPHLTVLATTRPWKIDQFSLIRSAHIDLMLELQGFSYENSMFFAERIFDRYYKDESAIAQLKQAICQNSVIKSLIHVPLLLLFIVHVWNERKSFPQTIHELYLEILNVMVNRYMEGKEGKLNDKGRQDEKKYVLQKTWPLETMNFILTPNLRNLSLILHFGEEFLAALCEVANHFLITATKETSLLFEEKAVLELLGKDGLSKLQTALELGILSHSESSGIFRKKICLTFLHKTVQEFLAAINICCREDRCNIFIDSLNTLDNVFQNEMIILFVAGISTSHCQKIYEKIYEVCDKDMDQHRAMIRVKYHNNLCRLYRDCIRESCGEPISLKLHHLYANNQEDWNVLQSTLRSTSNVRMLLLSKCTQLKCLKLAHCSLDDATLDLSESNCLTEVSLKDVTMKGKLLLSQCTQLKCLKLALCSLDDATLDLSESICLTELRLKDVTMKGKLLLLKCTQLRCLELAHCSLDDATLDLSESICLTELSLQYVTMKGKLLLSHCTQLRCLELAHCSLDDATLDLSESICLTELSLQYVTMKGKLLLSHCTQLRCLELAYCSLDDAILDLSESNCLTEFSLKDVTMKGKLFLSQCTQLRCLELTHCSLDDARWYKVTMTDTDKLWLSKCTLWTK